MRMRSAYRRSSAAMSVLVASALLSACDNGRNVLPITRPMPASSTAAPLPYTGDTALKTYYTQQIAWGRCTKSATPDNTEIKLSLFQCGTLSVPLDYANPATGTVTLALIREQAGDPAHRVGSLIVNPGGPGGSGLDMVESGVKDFNGPLHQDFDVVSFDPRGIGQSDPIQCLGDVQRDDLARVDPPADPKARLAKAQQDDKAYTTACEVHSGKLIPFMGTRNVARDMDVLRQVLGDKKLDYLGVSYGTYLGSLYAEEFPQNTGHLVLDGAVDPNADQTEAGAQQQIGFEKSLVNFATDCVTNHASQCPLGTDAKTAAAKAGAFLDGLRDHPLIAADGRNLTSGEGWTGTILFLYGDATNSWPYLRRALTAAMTKGDPAILMSAADQYDGRDASGHYSTQDDGLIAVRCADFADTVPSAAEVTKVYNELKSGAPILNTDLTPDDISQPPCRNWPFKTTEKPHPIVAAGSAPILVVGTTDDPATPYAAAVSLAKGFAKATLLTRVGEGHAAFGSGNVCVNDAMDAYLISGTMPAAGTRCTG